MRHFIRFSFGTLALAATACSGGSDQPTVSQELEQDLARAGGSSVELAGSSTPRIDVVSVSEQTERAVPSPRPTTVSRAPSANRGVKAPVRSARRVTPVAATPAPRAPEPAPAEVRRVEPEPEPIRAPQSRPRAPLPSTQPEPRGGWRTPGEVIRNAPFPINP